MGSGKPERKRTVFVMIDMQDKFVPAIDDIRNVISNAKILAESAGILGIPLLATEQYPKGLGHTVAELKPENVTEKTEFSCLANAGFAEKLEKLKPKDLVLFGIEAHVCVLQTALDALEMGYRVHVVSDAVSSRKQHDRDRALERMGQSGAFTVTTEMILFQLLEKAGTEEFRKISALVK
ncbi:MAG: hydrolase [Candidatus Aenigmarchaeota archaeon]|nr:hydrolase [Candidatus Aenigmarchaeota archaeon]